MSFLGLRTKLHPSILLSLDATELERDRRIQGALHAYLSNIRNQMTQDDAFPLATNIFPGFRELVVSEDRPKHYLAVGKKKGTYFHYEYAQLVADPDHVYFFSEGWMIDPSPLLREEDLVPSGVFHQNSDRESWEKALNQFAQNPRSRIRTMEDLRFENYAMNPQVFKAIGVHEAKLAKPLCRVGIRKGSPMEELNMHSGLWQPNGVVKAWRKGSDRGDTIRPLGISF